VGLARAQLPPGYDVERHFTPAYKPWDQRVCLVPDGDLFAAIRSGRASVLTDRIERFTEHGIRLASGRSSRPTSWSPPPGWNSRSRATFRSRSTASR
jgi:monooxygenase